AVALVGGRDGGGGEAADEFAGEPFERDRGGEGAVVVRGLGHHVEFGQALRGGGEGVDGLVGVLTVALLGEGGLLGGVGQGAQVDAADDHAVLDVVHRVGDVVGPVHDLAFQALGALGRVLADPGQA